MDLRAPQRIGLVKIIICNPYKTFKADCLKFMHFLEYTCIIHTYKL